MAAQKYSSMSFLKRTKKVQLAWDRLKNKQLCKHSLTGL